MITSISFENPSSEPVFGVPVKRLVVGPQKFNGILELECDCHMRQCSIVSRAEVLEVFYSGLKEELKSL